VRGRAKSRRVIGARPAQPQAHPNATTSVCSGHWVTWPHPASPSMNGTWSSESTWNTMAIRRPYRGQDGYSAPCTQAGHPGGTLTPGRPTV
jgi:hypothetical protein